jgi:hypothetical protein
MTSINSAADQVPHPQVLRPLQLLPLSRWRPHLDPLDREIPLPESLLREVWKFWESEIRGCCYFHPSPCSQTRPISVGEPMWTMSIYPRSARCPRRSPRCHQHLGTQVCPARCKTLLYSIKEPESVPAFGQFHGSGLHSKTGRYPLPSSLQNDMGASPVLPSREHSPRSMAYTGEAQHTGRRPFQIEQASLHRVDTTHGHCPSCSIVFHSTYHLCWIRKRWQWMNAYTFPPTPLIQAVLSKVMMDRVRLCLIAPCWPSHAWFPTLLELLTDHPRRLPEWDHLLWHPLGRVYHKSPSFYKLHAWKLLGASSEQRNFLSTLSAASPLLRGGEPLTHISQSGLSTRLGVGKKGYILSFPLFPS